MPKRDKYHPDYKKLYPGVTITPEVMNALKCSDRKMEYMEVDLKNDSTRKDLETQTPVLIPRREDSLERMQEEENHIFTSTAPSPEDKTIHDDELNRLHRALGMLEQKEYALICSLYFEGFTERAYAEQVRSARMLKAEAEHSEQDATGYDERMGLVSGAIEMDSGAIEEYDDIMVRQLISNIKVLDKETILVRFKDGTEIQQRIERTKGARVS